MYPRSFHLMGVLYIESDERGAGKTALCVSLAHSLASRGIKTAVFKPFSVTPKDDPDSDIYQALLGQQKSEWPFLAPKGDLTPEVTEKIINALRMVQENQDTLIVEGSSSLSNAASANLVELLDAKTLVVLRYRSDLDTSKLKSLKTMFGDRFIGVVTNGLTQYQKHTANSKVVTSMESEGITSLGLIPEDRQLLAPTVEQLATHLNGRFTVGEKFTDGIIEHIMVGGLGLDNGIDYFRLRNEKAVVVRGDRPDIQMAALHTPTTCMVLTQDTEPIEYVRNEAELEGIPVIVVPTNTLDTMASLNNMQELIRFDHATKLERFIDLMETHIDVNPIHDALDIHS